MYVYIEVISVFCIPYKENEELSLVEVLIIWSTYSSENTKKLLDTKRHGHIIDTSKKKNRQEETIDDPDTGFSS